MIEGFDKLPWLERVSSVIDNDIAKGKPGLPIGYIVAALIRALHEKGVLSSKERDGLFAAWDRVDALHRETSEKELKALREQYPELSASVLGATSDPS